MNKLFVYGSLLDKNLRNNIVGRRIEGEEDTLSGFSKEWIIGGRYPRIYEDENPEEQIIGEVILLTDDELKTIDGYEGWMYRRIKVILDSEEEVLVYAR